MKWSWMEQKPTPAKPNHSIQSNQLLFLLIWWMNELGWSELLNFLCFGWVWLGKAVGYGRWPPTNKAKGMNQWTEEKESSAAEVEEESNEWNQINLFYLIEFMRHDETKQAVNQAAPLRGKPTRRQQKKQTNCFFSGWLGRRASLLLFNLFLYGCGQQRQSTKLIGGACSATRKKTSPRFTFKFSIWICEAKIKNKTFNLLNEN